MMRAWKCAVLGVVAVASCVVYAACPNGYCKDNTAKQTYKCSYYNACDEKSAINTSETCGINDTTWSSDNCVQGADANGDLPKYTPVQYPNFASTAGSQWKCQVGYDVIHNNVPILKYLDTPNSGSCTYITGHECTCNASVYQPPVGRVTQCRS